jgi:5'-nucleotidase
MRLILAFIITFVLANAKVITIIGTGDLQGALEPIETKADLNNSGKKEKVTLGGIARLATLYKEAKSQNPDTIVVSGGDDLMNKYFQVYRGKAIYDLMSMAGYEYVVLGNHEFDRGSDSLAKALNVAKFKVICSDLNVENSNLKGKCAKYDIKNLSGIKVGLFSLIVEDLTNLTSEKKVKLNGSNVEIAKKMIKLLRDKGANVVVLISHIGYKADVALAKQVKGIDLIFGAHSHSYVKKMGHIGKTNIVNGGEQGVFVVKVDIPIKNGKVLHKQVTMQKIAVTSKYKDNSKVLAKLNEYKKGLPKTIKLGITKKDWDLHSRVVRRGESNVINMVNDLLRKKYKVDIVLNNAGAFRGNKIYPKGDITNSMLKEIDEFANSAFMLKIKGKYIKQILERSGGNYGNGGFMHTSGLKYKVFLPGSVQKIKDEKIVAKGSRVKDIKVLEDDRWVDIDDNKTYSVLTNAFIALKGGDGYFWFKKYGSDFKNTYETFYSIMANVGQEKGELTPSKKDGRLGVEH